MRCVDRVMYHVGDLVNIYDSREWHRTRVTSVVRISFEFPLLRLLLLFVSFLLARLLGLPSSQNRFRLVSC
jgi:hypothetical protein